MKKTKKIFALALCAGLTMTTLTGCSPLSSLKNAITHKDTTKEKTQEEVSPTIDNAKSYIDLADYKTVTLKTADIDKELKAKIDSTLESNVTYKKIKKGKVKKGDTVNIYYVGKVNGKTFDGGSCTKETTPEGYDLEIGSNTFIDGFEDQLIGKQIGKTVDIKVTFPKKYSQNESLAGKDAVFTVTLNSKQGKKITPKFTDAFVKKNLTDYKSVKDYKKKNRAEIIKSQAITKVCEDTKVNKYPKAKLDQMKKQLRTSIENYLAQQNYTLNDYLKNYNMTKKDYDKQIETTAKEDVGKQLVYNAIAQAEDLAVTDEEYKKELKSYLSNYKCKKKSELDKVFQSSYGTTAKSIIYSDLLYSKVAEYVAGNVKEA